MILGLDTSKQLPWLKSLPTNWQIVRLRELFSLSDDRSNDENPEVLSLTLKGIVKRDISNNEGQLAETYSGYKKICKNDIVFNPMDLLSGYVAKSGFEGVISPAYSVIRPFKDINLSYFTYYFQTHYHLHIFHPFGKGVSLDHRWELKDRDLLNFPISFPPVDTQRKIAQYLDSKIDKIDKFIFNKTKFIHLLIEQKQAVINSKISGISISEKVKTNSDIAWLPQNPSGWKTYPIKRLCTLNDEALSEKTDPDKLLLYIDIGSVDSDGLVNRREEFIFKNAPSRARRIVKDGDVIISTVRTYLKAISLIQNPENNLVVSTGFTVLRPSDKVESEYLEYALRADYFIQKVVSLSYGVSYPAINPSVLGSLKIALPGDREEQKNIVKSINQECKTIDNAIQKAEQQIKLIKEYKISLIANAVMGQLEIKD